MKVALLTRDLPTEVDGGASARVERLARELSGLVDVEVHCSGAPGESRLVAATYEPWDELPLRPPGTALRVMSVHLAMAAGVQGADLLHSHGWSTNLAGHLGKLLHGPPHVVTCHSLERLRPWTSEQRGGDHALSLICERTAVEGADAVIVVSAARRADLLGICPAIEPGRVVVIHDAVDAEAYRPDPSATALDRLGLDPGRPIVVVAGPMARGQEVLLMLDVTRHIDPGAQLVLWAAAPDAERLGQQMRRGLEGLRSARDGIVWLDGPLPRVEMVQLLSHAAALVSPSVSATLASVAVEAMACEAPVVAGATPGNQETVCHGETGYLVPFDVAEDGASPAHPATFALDLAHRVNGLLADPATAHRLGQAGRWRVLEQFSWPVVARKTVALYERVLAGPPGP